MAQRNVPASRKQRRGRGRVQRPRPFLVSGHRAEPRTSSFGYRHLPRRQLREQHSLLVVHATPLALHIQAGSVAQLPSAQSFRPSQSSSSVLVHVELGTSLAAGFPQSTEQLHLVSAPPQVASPQQ